MQAETLYLHEMYDNHCRAGCSKCYMSLYHEARNRQDSSSALDVAIKYPEVNSIIRTIHLDPIPGKSTTDTDRRERLISVLSKPDPCVVKLLGCPSSVTKYLITDTSNANFLTPEEIQEKGIRGIRISPHGNMKQLSSALERHNHKGYEYFAVLFTVGLDNPDHFRTIIPLLKDTSKQNTRFFLEINLVKPYTFDDLTMFMNARASLTEFENDNRVVFDKCIDRVHNKWDCSMPEHSIASVTVINEEYFYCGYPLAECIAKLSDQGE